MQPSFWHRQLARVVIDYRVHFKMNVCYVILLFIVLEGVHCDDLRSSIRMLALADWGGNEIDPYTTPSQVVTAQAMGVIGMYMMFIVCIVLY